MNYSSHLVVAKQLLSNYSWQTPLHFYLKDYFRKNKKHGSRDRRLISELCYNFFRLGFAAKNLAIEDGILTGFFLCNNSHSDFLQFFKPEWNNRISDNLEQKLAFLNWKQPVIFPFKDELNNEVDYEKFNVSFFQQPKLFIRIRPGSEDTVSSKLKEAGVIYEKVTQSCIALPNSVKIDSILELDKEAVVQDYNSQKVGTLINLAIDDLQSGKDLSLIRVWDCCSGSGGKSIMAYDIDSKIQLTVSDKRKSILQNLQNRFSVAGIKNYDSYVADLSADNNEDVNQKFDLILADVPCTGSGTWSRTPEQLYYFKQSEIKKYSDLQKQIVKNAMPYLKQDGYLLYITCSVFKKENEDVASFIEDTFKMHSVKTKLLRGYEIEADTMFAALLKAV